MKIYIANRQISIGITMGDKQRSIDFVAMYGSGSTFKTNNKAEQKAIEAHPEYGKLFKLYLSDEPEEEDKGGADLGTETGSAKDGAGDACQDKILEVETVGAAEGDGSPAETETGQGGSKCGSETEGVKDGDETEGAKDGAGEAQEMDGAGETQEMEFECFEDAREWVSETMGIPKKKLMSKTAVIRYGSDAGYVITIKG